MKVIAGLPEGVPFAIQQVLKLQRQKIALKRISIGSRNIYAFDIHCFNSSMQYLKKNQCCKPFMVAY
jgi:hypothetical protein